MSTVPIVTPAVQITLPAADIAGIWDGPSIELAAVSAAEFLSVPAETLQLMDISSSMTGDTVTFTFYPRSTA